MTLERKESFLTPERELKEIVFEGIRIQWDKRTWEFHQEDGSINSIDTYSIWNPAYWDEIAQRLSNGEICGMYIMGNFGTGEVREAPEWPAKTNENLMFDKIKKRPKDQNFVAFINPEDAIDILDIDRFPKEHQHLRWAGKRLNSYAGPQHNIFPVRNNGMVNSGLVRKEDNTIACFWIPGHTGYEGIASKLRKKIKHGIFGGGSLNIHGDEPSYNSEELYEKFENEPDWQEGISFIIFDELAEASQVGRSQTMINFAIAPPKLVRAGSLSPNYIREKTGYEIPFSEVDLENGKVRKASSLTPYDGTHNDEVNKRVEEVMGRIDRFTDFLNRQDRR